MRTNLPTHDPYTGEINPYYEELTGEKNPLSYKVPVTKNLKDLNDRLIELANNRGVDYESKILTLETYLKSIAFNVVDGSWHDFSFTVIPSMKFTSQIELFEDINNASAAVVS